MMNLQLATDKLFDNVGFLHPEARRSRVLVSRDFVILRLRASLVNRGHDHIAIVPVSYTHLTLPTILLV